MNREDKADREFELLKLEFDKCLDQRRFEIENFWKRGWFFGALILAIATAYFQVKGGDTAYRVYIAFLGLCVSFFQGLMNRGSKYWQERWECKTKRIESLLGIDVTKTKNFEEKEKYFLDAGVLAKSEWMLTRARRYSVSKLTVLVIDIITLSWFMLWLSNLDLGWIPWLSRLDGAKSVTIIHFVYIGYIFLFWFRGKVIEPFLREVKPLDGRVRDVYFRDSEMYIKGDKAIDALVRERLAIYSTRKVNRWKRIKVWIWKNVL